MIRSVGIITTGYPTWTEQNAIIRGKFIHELARALVEAGLDVHVITMHGEGTQTYEERDGVKIHRFHYFVKRWETLTKGAGIPENIKKFTTQVQIPFYFLSLGINAFRVIRRHRLDIINVHWAFPPGYLGVYLKLLTGRRLITTVYGAEVYPLLAGNLSFLKPFLKSALIRADALVGISPATAQAAQQVSGRTDIAVIPYGIDLDYYVPGPKNQALLAKYHCQHKRVLFFTGRMVERKGHRYALEAMRYLREKMPEAKLILGGLGPCYEELCRLRDEWGLQDVVEMPGFIPERELVPLLQSVNVYVLPSCIDQKGDREGSALAALEAMACGTPALISKVGGNKEAIIEGQGAYYFEPADAADLAQKSLNILKDPQTLSANKLLARTYITQHYAWEIMIQKYLHLFI